MSHHRALATAFLLATLATPSVAGTWYVKRDAGSGGDGLSWAKAYQRVQDGLAAAIAGDEVWVAKATYRPGDGASPRSVSFEMKAGVSVYGGFIGTETSLGQRDWRTNETILSGDLLLDDQPNFVNRADNCYHVVRINGGSGPLDGFTIRGGNADSGPEYVNNIGGAIVVNVGGSGSVANLTITDNWAFLGGGIGHDGGGALLVTDCILRGNSALLGGGVSATASGPVTLRNCLVTGNEATSTSFVHPGGGAWSFDGSLSLYNCTVAYNLGGGAVLCCAFTGGVIRNSIVWGNHLANGDTSFAAQLVHASGNPQIVHDDDVENSSPPYLNLDPHWVDPIGPDGVAGTGDEDFRLACTSPLIDHGTNSVVVATTDLAGDPRLSDDPATADLGVGAAPIVDLGPYEFSCGCGDVASYCSALPNTSGAPASIASSGSTSLFANTFTLLVSGGPPLKNGLFYYGPLQTSVPWGDGVRCVGGSLQRLSVIQLDALGAAASPLDFTQAPVGSGPHAITPGSTSNFQFYFRDPLGGPAGWNYSNALGVTFCP